MAQKTYEYNDINPENDASTGQNLSFDLLEGVRTRRILAFLLDYVVVGILSAIAALVVGILGILTLGLGWLLYLVLVPLVAIAYVAFTMGGEKQATIGMEFFSLKLVRLDEGTIDPALAVLHSVLFWVIHVLGTPILLAASLFSSKKRLLQDLLLGTVIVRSDKN